MHNVHFFKMLASHCCRSKLYKYMQDQVALDQRFLRQSSSLYISWFAPDSHLIRIITYRSFTWSTFTSCLQTNPSNEEMSSCFKTSTFVHNGDLSCMVAKCDTGLFAVEFFSLLGNLWIDILVNIVTFCKLFQNSKESTAPVERPWAWGKDWEVPCSLGTLFFAS